MKLKLWTATLCCGALMAGLSTFAMADPARPINTAQGQPTTIQTTNGDFVEYFSVPPPAPLPQAPPPPSNNNSYGTPQFHPRGSAPGYAAPPPVPYYGNGPLSTNPYPFGRPDPELDAGFYGAGYGGYLYDSGYPSFDSFLLVPGFRRGFDHGHRHDGR